MNAIYVFAASDAYSNEIFIELRTLKYIPVFTLSFVFSSRITNLFLKLSFITKVAGARIS